MAVYTDVAAEDLARFLAGYDIGELLAYKGIAEGVENSNFLVHTAKGHFILTLYERRVAERDLPFFLSLMEHLAGRGINCPQPVKNGTFASNWELSAARAITVVKLLIASGVPILEGLDITARTAGNAVVEKALQQVRKSLEEGKSLTEPLKDSEVFPGMVTQMISVGEQTGAMDAMLQKIADFYEEEVDAAVKDLLTALEPIMIVFLGVVVGGVVISMYLPLFSLIGKLSQMH